MSALNQNGWNEYSKLVIAELERLNEGLIDLNDDVKGLIDQLSEVKSRESDIDSLKKWKETVDDIISPTQLKELITTVSELKTFKTQAITIWTVVNFIFLAIIAILQIKF